MRVNALQYLKEKNYFYYVKYRDKLELIILKYLIYLSRIDKHLAIKFKNKILGVKYSPVLTLGIVPFRKIIFIRLLGFDTYLNMVYIITTFFKKRPIQ